MSRFTLVNDVLYTISGSDLQLISVTDPAVPALWNRISIQFGIETLFPYGKYLFVGSQTGVYIYDNTNPLFPEYVSQFNHAQSCDPVVVQGNYAYITLRGSARCRRGLNQLDILNIADITHPQLEKSYPMQEPYGLGVSDDTLFVCDGTAGLKVFNVKDKRAIEFKQALSSVNCYDVIPNNGILLVSATTGLIQYDYSGTELAQLSEIKINGGIEK